MALILAVLIVLLAPNLATAQEAIGSAMARVRLTTDPKVPVGCTTLGAVDDESPRELRRKIVRLGGDTALLSFPIEVPERINAIVFRCPPEAAAVPRTPPPATPAPPPAPNAPPPPPRVPPPAGVPPPPPPAGSAPSP